MMHNFLQVYARLNQVNVCMSYSATLSLLDKISKLHTTPLSMWTLNNTPFMFWGDNLDKQRRVRDVRSTRHGALLHMYHILAGCSRTTDPTLCQTGRVASLSSISANSLHPTHSDFSCIKVNLVVTCCQVAYVIHEGSETFF